MTDKEAIERVFQLACNGTAVAFTLGGQGEARDSAWFELAQAMMKLWPELTQQECTNELSNHVKER